MLTVNLCQKCHNSGPMEMKGQFFIYLEAKAYLIISEKCQI